MSRAMNRPLLALAIGLSTGLAGSLAPPAAWAQARPDTAAAPAEAATAFTVKLLDDLAKVARSDAPKAQRDAKVREIVAARLATARIGRFLLGSYRAKASPEQAARYDALIPTYIADEFSNRIDDLALQNPQVGATVLISPSEARVRTSFKRKRDGSIVNVDWRVVQEAGQWRLYDVYVNGVSRLVIRRQEFSAVIDRQGFDALLKLIAARAT